MTERAFRFVDLSSRAVSEDIETIFSGWKVGDERVVILSPHDDDGILGAGYLMLAARSWGGDVHVIVYCDGRAGYSTLDDKNDIIEIRRQETTAAYGAVGVPEGNVHRLEYDDCSTPPYLGLYLYGDRQGMIGRSLALLRGIEATRLVIPNGYREHIDHETVFKCGIYGGPLVGDPVLPDLGRTEPIRSMVQYAVWGDFSPTLGSSEGPGRLIRADVLTLCEDSLADKVNDAIARWQSQSSIIKGLIKARNARRYRGYMMEAYRSLNPRPALDYTLYAKFLESTFGGEL